MSSRDNLLLVMTGSSIFTVGVLALCAHFSSAVLRERILLWFGLFAAPYGLALVCRSILIPQWDGSAEQIIVDLGRVTYLATSIPALLLFQEFYGPGWRLSSKWLMWIYAVALLGLFFLMVTYERRRTIPSPGLALVILVPLELLIDRLAGYRPPPIKGRLVIFTGLLVFFLTFSCDRLSTLRITRVHVPAEPFGFLFLMACLGYVVSKRVAANEAEWISLTGEMRAARKIQDAILPSSMPTFRSPWAVAARYAPMSGVAGDFYGFPRVLPNSLGIILADVMGHGVAAALIASMVKVAVFNGAERGLSPAKIVQELNRTLCKEAPGQLASAIYIELNQEGSLARYTAGGQPPPLLWRRSEQRLDPLNSAGLLLGVRREEPYEDTTLHFARGDRLLIYSDGLTEAENGKGESFGDAMLPNLFALKQNLSAETFAEALLQSVLAWSMEDSRPGQADDITFVIVDL
jgi:sigma-B regulation protein RsbU (phosphoserine phosphatase)